MQKQCPICGTFYVDDYVPKKLDKETRKIGKDLIQGKKWICGSCWDKNANDKSYDERSGTYPLPNRKRVHEYKKEMWWYIPDKKKNKAHVFVRDRRYPDYLRAVCKKTSRKAKTFFDLECIKDKTVYCRECINISKELGGNGWKIHKEGALIKEAK